MTQVTYTDILTSSAGYTLAECAGLTGYSTAMWSRAERGERSVSPKAKVNIARRLGVSVAELFPVDAVLDEADVSAARLPSAS